MTSAEFFGCLLLAFSPPFAMFWFTIKPDPVRVIIFVAAAFFWLLSLLLSSFWWFIFYPLRDTLLYGLIFSVIFQEIFRGVIYTILRKAELGLTKITDDTTKLIENKHILSYVSGLGFGFMNGAFSLMNILADSVGPGTMGIMATGKNEMFFITSSATGLCFILLHTFWSVIFFDAMDKKKKLELGIVVASHFLASSLTLLNKYQIYSATIVPIAFITLFMGLLAFKVAGGSYNSLKTCLVSR